ncbi:hypothetical protein K432DRAFT_301615 [Lepidopterella palustris CBS 459.81]|uniref:Lipid droplet-associated hydrolase n=1 Tax=Lepidopterella palustris CBS 459.81 TaxID=1314670 RepID=A0A8E2E7C3_9PEZI|nr:hypothetical protein K432DRAFT_301615 [Lepidopterella palustris CBS 459.81]
MPPSLPSTIRLRAPPSPLQTPSRTYIVFFITGNPGLISYYTTFLTHLHALLCISNERARTAQIHIYGRSLAGFEVDDRSTSSSTSQGLGSPPYSLNAQIIATEEALRAVVRDERERLRKEGDGTGDVRVVLMGHSVGAYILLEILRRGREVLMMGVDGEGEDGLRISGGICLFPTVVHIASSKSGRRAEPLLRNASVPHLASLLVKLLTFFLPSAILQFLMRTLLSFPPDAASTTAAFVKSKWGVRQALHMARDEMMEITADKWDEEVWGAAHPTKLRHERAQLRFLFGKNDHWVANETRDDLIRARAGGNGGGKEEGERGRGKEEGQVEHWKPVMEVDEEEGLDHAFCIRQSIPVAERVAGYLVDIVGRDLEGL